jgi:hypothetical protein
MICSEPSRQGCMWGCGNVEEGGINANRDGNDCFPRGAHEITSRNIRQRHSGRKGGKGHFMWKELCMQRLKLQEGRSV